MYHKFFKYLSLNVLGMLGMSGYILADTFFVSQRLGANGLASLNIAISIFGLMNGIGMMLGVGGATRYSICKAKKDDQKANKTFVLSVGTGLIIGIAFVLVGIFFSRNLAMMLGANQEILDMCHSYLQTVMMFAPFFILNHTMIAFVRHDGSPQLAMAAMLLGSLSNIVLDYVFMYPLEMGIFGAALATGIAPVIGLCISSIHSLLKKNQFHFVRASFSFSDIFDIMGLGNVAFINEFASGVVLVVFNLLILKYLENTGVAAYGIVANLGLVSLAIFTGISQGVQPLMSHAYGMEHHKEVKWVYHRAVIVCAVVGMALLAVAYIWCDPLVTLFNSEHDMLLQSIAKEGLVIYFIGFLFVGYNLMSASLLSAIEMPRYSFMISIFRGLIGIVGIVFILSSLLEVTGIWLTFPTVELICAIMSYTLVYRANKKRQYH